MPSAVTVAPGTTDIKPCKWYIRYTRYTYKLDSGSKRFRRGGRAGEQRLASLESFWPRTVSESGRERTAVACVPVKPASTGAKRNVEGRPRRMRPNGTFSPLAWNFEFSAGPRVCSLWLYLLYGEGHSL